MSADYLAGRCAREGWECYGAFGAMGGGEERAAGVEDGGKVGVSAFNDEQKLFAPFVARFGCEVEGAGDGGGDFSLDNLGMQLDAAGVDDVVDASEPTEGGGGDKGDGVVGDEPPEGVTCGGDSEGAMLGVDVECDAGHGNEGSIRDRKRSEGNMAACLGHSIGGVGSERKG